MLALMVGVIQLALGVFKLGVIVNFLSHPVIVGFTNAAAIIIGLSQVNKLIGVPMGRSRAFHQGHLGRGQAGRRHPPADPGHGRGWPLPSCGHHARYAPKLPGVLIAVVLTTMLSWLIGFERNATATLEQIAEPEAKPLLSRVRPHRGAHQEINEQIAAKTGELKTLHKARREVAHEVVTLQLRNRPAASSSSRTARTRIAAATARAQLRLRAGGRRRWRAARYFAEGKGRPAPRRDADGPAGASPRPPAAA